MLALSRSAWLVALVALVACVHTADEEGVGRSAGELADGSETATCGDFLKSRVFGRTDAGLDKALAPLRPVCAPKSPDGAKTVDCRGANSCFLDVSCGTLETVGWRNLRCYQDSQDRDGEGLGPTRGATRCTPTADCNFCCEVGAPVDPAAPPPREAGAPEPTPRPVPIDASVVVVAYDPIVDGGGGRRVPLHERMGWRDPAGLAAATAQAVNVASGGAVRYRIARTLVRDEFPVKRDGFRYSEGSYLEAARTGNWRKPDAVSYARIMEAGSLARVMRDTGASEIWLVGAPGFGWDELAYKTPGDGLYYPTTNPWLYRPYDLPDLGRTYWVMGLNYERGVAEAVHSYGHRVESMMSITVGGGAWDSKSGPPNAWNQFTRNGMDGVVSGCGNVHIPPNGQAGYDYANRRAVLSTCDDWRSFPALTGATTNVSAASWGPSADPQLAYLHYWLEHLPRRDGTYQGFHTNWWRYIADYDRAVASAPLPGGILQRARVAMY